MPQVSLVVCLHREKELLARLLDAAGGCYDDLVVVHDGPDSTGIRALVEARSARFFERPRAYYEEHHWPFAWGRARHDWILRWDADELPSAELRDWIEDFRARPEPDMDVSGFTCIWPLWDGRRARTRRWPHRLFLLNRQRVRMFGLAHQPPVPDGGIIGLDLILRHEPERPNYGAWNVLRRRASRRWRVINARALLGKPTDLPCWRWDDPEWPRKWEQIRRRPLLTAATRLVMSPWWNARDMMRCGELPRPSCLVSFPLEHVGTCVRHHRLKRRSRGGTEPRPADDRAAP